MVSPYRPLVDTFKLNTSSRYSLQTLLPKLYRNMHDGSNQNRRQKRPDGNRPAEQSADHQNRHFHDRPDAADRPSCPLRQDQGQTVPRTRPQPGSDIHPRTESGQTDPQNQKNPSDQKGRGCRNPVQIEQGVDEQAHQNHVEHRSDLREPALHPRRDGDQNEADQLNPHPDGQGRRLSQPDVEHVPGRHAQIRLYREDNAEGHGPQTRHKKHPAPQTIPDFLPVESTHPHLSPLPLFSIPSVRKIPITPAPLPRAAECGMHEKGMSVRQGDVGHGPV